MKVYSTIILSLLLGSNVHAQFTNWSIGDFMQKLPKTDYQVMQYDYKVVLENIKTNQNVDSMYGHLAVSRNKFIDSNKLFFIAKNQTSYCKLDHIDKTATIFNLKDLEKKLKMPIGNDQSGGITLPEQIMNTEGQNFIWDLSNPMFYRLRFTFKDRKITAAQLDFKKSDTSLIGAYFQVNDELEEENGNHYRRSYYVYNIRSVVHDETFELSRIYGKNRGQTILNTKYANYKLIKVIK